MENEKNNLMVLDSSEQNYKAVQTVFHLLTAKRDTKTKIFNKDVRIDLESIDDLNDRIVRKLRNHFGDEKDPVYNITVHVNFSDYRDLTFSNWDEYKKYELTSPSMIKNITIKWSALINLPNYQTPAMHELVVKITDGLKPQEYIHLVFSGKLEEVENINFDSPVVASVDFIDSQIGDELINIVSTWVETVKLPKNERNLLAKLSKHKVKICRFLTNVTTMVVILFSSQIFINIIKSFKKKLLLEITVSEFCFLIDVLLVIFFCIFFINRLAYYLSNAIYKSFEEYRMSHVFNITKGDRQEIDKIEIAKKQNNKRIITSFTITCGINIVCGIIATIITNYFL